MNPEDDVLRAAILKEADHIMKCVLPGGSINMVPPDTMSQGAYIIPYFAVHAALGLDTAALLESAKAKSYIAASEKFYQWYTQHMNADGSIYDFTGGTCQNPASSGKADSVDSYAAIFVWGVYIHYTTLQKISPTTATAFLNSMKPYCLKAINAWVSLQQADGLTIPLKTYPMEYLMNNLEVYRGFNVGNILGLFDGSPSMSKMISTINGKFWVPDGYFAWARDPANGALSQGWSKWYPDKMANAWAAWSSFLDPTKRAAVYAKIKADFPDGPTAWGVAGTDLVYLAISALGQNDRAQALVYLNEMLTHERAEGGFFTPPYYYFGYISGWFIAACTMYINNNLTPLDTGGFDYRILAVLLIVVLFLFLLSRGL